MSTSDIAGVNGEAMPGVLEPSVQRRRLRTELRKARDTAGLKQADVAKAMDWSPSKLIRIENGAVSISTNDLRALLEHYKVKDRGRVGSLLEMAKSARAGSFYDAYSDVVGPGFRDYLALESAASVIRQWDPLLISGLLQTEEYALAVLSDVYRLNEEQARRAWAVREHRQEVHDREDPPEIRLVLDENALRRQVRPGTNLMRRQIERVIEFAALDHVTILLLPNAAGAHPGMAGNFYLLEFSETDLEDLVGVEAVSDFEIKSDLGVLANYVDLFQSLEDRSLSPEDSVVFMEKLLGEQPHAETAPAPEAVAG
jgi:transcriptional regulator with XRE-family HTH domain